MSSFHIRSPLPAPGSVREPWSSGDGALAGEPLPDGVLPPPDEGRGAFPVEPVDPEEAAGRGVEVL
ncbi:MAG: hypothetical protein KY461_06655, partial [Actinobacteria bacterium]|nr:hypothetical protein [Actinomycetota bacterium]